MNATGSIGPRRLAGPAVRVLLALTLVVSAASCRRESVAGPDGGTTSFTLRIGQYRLLEQGGPSVGFERVVMESRCPTRVTCVWEGEARVRIAMVAASADTTHLELSTQTAQRQGEALGYRITLERLEPYPEESGPIPDADYRLVLTAVKL